LAKVLEFCTHHLDNKLPEIEKASPRRGEARRAAAAAGRLARTSRPTSARGRPAPSSLPRAQTPQPLRSANLSDFVPEWDAKFVDIPQEALFELILAVR
jgi:hypothetical protein